MRWQRLSSKIRNPEYKAEALTKKMKEGQLLLSPRLSQLDTNVQLMDRSDA
jgi:hypothetical protein